MDLSLTEYMENRRKVSHIKETGLHFSNKYQINLKKVGELDRGYFFSDKSKI